ncbi:hypothetical protein EON63_22150 [archaeon]|nr:MAG: hypothetical protein EON63_22150 [archaeon]
MCGVLCQGIVMCVYGMCVCLYVWAHVYGVYEYGWWNGMFVNNEQLTLNEYTLRMENWYLKLPFPLYSVSCKSER